MSFWFDQSGAVFRAAIVIGLSTEDRFTRRCLIEELTQAMGLPADKALYRPTVFTNDPPHSSRLSMNDMILLRALYDPRLRAGMPRDEAMERVAVIIPELVAAVKERGVEALYQR